MIDIEDKKLDVAHGVTNMHTWRKKKTGGAGTRILDLLHAKQTLYQLSYTPNAHSCWVKF